MIKTFTRFGFVGILAALCVSQTAKADLVPTLNSTTISGVNTVFHYTIALTINSKIAGGGVNDFFTFYDFAGYIPNSGVIVNSVGTWVKTEQNSGPIPALTAPPDDPTKLNITFTYTAAASVTGPVTNVLSVDLTSSLPLSGFVFTPYAGSSTNNQNNSVQGNAGFVQGPNPVPEPSTFILLGLGGVLCTLHARRVRNARVA